MPYKDIKKQKEYTKQQRYKKWIKKYTFIFQKMEGYSFEDKVTYLSNIHGRTRLKIYKNFTVPFSDQIESEIKKIQNSKYYLKQKPNTKKRMDNNWDFIKKWMIKRGCNCGEKNITKLSFHHLYPNKKKRYIRQMCGNSIKRIKEELKKGVVKCKNCHTIIHAGTSKERESSLVSQYINANSKRKRYDKRNKLLIWELKKHLSCIKCGVSDPVILLFHHINSRFKNEKICLMYKTSRGIINQEIAKTTCLCHNCHEDFHYIIGYHVPTTQSQLEQYVGKKIIPLKIDIRD